MATKLPTILETIVATRRTHLPDIQSRIAHVDPTTLAVSTRSLADHLQGRGAGHFILECKSASPSLGLIRPEYHPGEIARIYSRYASAISVLCEPAYFGGDYDHLATVAANTHLPVLCKDFIIDPCQIIAARYFGADAVLLMLSVLDDATYTTLATLAASFGLDVLTEVSTTDEALRARGLGARIVGINHRNLHDLSIDLSRLDALASLLDDDTIIVAESGIRDHATVTRLQGKCNGFLVGSQLTSQPDIDRAARTLIYGTHKVCGLSTPASAQLAKSAGAVYGGLIFEDSSIRNVSRETSQTIIAAEPGLNYVAVSRRTSGWDRLIQPGIVAVQIHSPYQGSVSKEAALIAQVRREVGPDIELWRAIAMDQAHGPTLACELAESVDKLVLDSGAGGTGKSFAWERIPAAVLEKSLLAGGIHAGNVTAALQVGAAGLDLNSGVEYPRESKFAGAKDAHAVQAVLHTIRRYYQGV